VKGDGQFPFGDFHAPFFWVHELHFVVKVNVIISGIFALQFHFVDSGALMKASNTTDYSTERKTTCFVYCWPTPQTANSVRTDDFLKGNFIVIFTHLGVNYRPLPQM